MNVSSGYRKYGFDAYGGKYLQKSDMSYWMNNPRRTDPGGICFELGEDVEDVEADFFELLPTLNQLWILNPKCHIYMTDAHTFIRTANARASRPGIPAAVRSGSISPKTST